MLLKRNRTDFKASAKRSDISSGARRRKNDLASGEKLLREYQTKREQIRACYERYFRADSAKRGIAWKARLVHHPPTCVRRTSGQSPVF